MVPGIPSGLVVQAGNGQVFLSWNIIAGATSYDIYMSTDGVTFASLGTSPVNSYLDITATLNTLYYYQVRSVNGSGTSSFTSSVSIIPTAPGIMSLAAVRLQAQQRADRVGSNFVGLAEWNTYINQSAFELYDLLVTLYEDYYVADPVQFSTDGSASYDLTTIAPNFYKLLGVDLGATNNVNSRVNVRKFNFIDRNKNIYPNQAITALGLTDLEYRLLGNTITFRPVPSGGQVFTLWYVPRMTQLLQDTDVLDGVSGWTEYVIVDAAIRALQKEESDVSILMAQKQMLKQRIEETAMNRDAGAPDTISDTKNSGGWYSNWGGYGGGWY